MSHWVRMAIINKLTNTKCWRGYGGKRALLHCWWECKLVQPLMKIIRRCLRKLKVELPYDLAIPHLGIYLGKTIIQKDTCMFIAALCTVAKTWKQPKCPLTDKWIKMYVYICMYVYVYIYIYIHTHTHNGTLTIKNTAICSNMDAIRDCLSNLLRLV